MLSQPNRLVLLPAVTQKVLNANVPDKDSRGDRPLRR